MKIHSFYVENLKCHGCANTISKEVSKFSSVQNVIVDVEQARIDLELNDGEEQIDQIKEKLAKIGYPEMGTRNNFTTAARSYISCAVGRMGSKE